MVSNLQGFKAVDYGVVTGVGLVEMIATSNATSNILQIARRDTLAFPPGATIGVVLVATMEIQ